MNDISRHFLLISENIPGGGGGAIRTSSPTYICITTTIWKCLAPALPVVGVADENIDFIFKVGSDFVKITFSRSGLRYNLGPR